MDLFFVETRLGIVFKRDIYEIGSHGQHYEGQAILKSYNKNNVDYISVKYKEDQESYDVNSSFTKITNEIWEFKNGKFTIQNRQ